MRLPLREVGRDASLAYLQAVLPPQDGEVSISYKTHLGALLRVDGVAAGAYDREHREVVLPASERERELRLEVELQALPTNGLPSGPGIIWSYLNWRSRAEPDKSIGVSGVRPSMPQGPSTKPRGEASNHQDDKGSDRVPVFGHSHLDVAWLWSYEQTRRKAQRTFAIACDLLDRDPSFRFVQTQPQLYAFVEESDPQLFERVRAHVAAGRFDARVAAMWVESDCNIPSGESLLRQMLYGCAYIKEKFGIEPEAAWLPDTFGFMNTLPQLLAHAGIGAFATTKLQWNDTTKFPFPQFVWQGPDGSSVAGALLQGYDGPAYPWRVANAAKRGEPVAVGYGDGGGGVTQSMLDFARHKGEWIDFVGWLRGLNARRAQLPEYTGELYLEYHRGVYTTHHGMKMHNALCERALAEAEELLAWCTAVHVPRAMLTEHVKRVREAWHIVLRQQFHDVLPGTSIAQVYEDAAQEYAEAETLIASAINAAETMLPRALTHTPPGLVAPVDDGGGAVFDNGLLRARVRADGTVAELQVPGGRNVCTQANALALYRDRPKQWEAWNIDRGYEKHVQTAKPQKSRIEDGGFTVDLLLGDSPASLRFELVEGEPFLRVRLNVDWRERRTLLRIENWLAVQTEAVTYGAPHGTIVRSARDKTPEERAKFEVPGQRFAYAADSSGEGFALLALDTYGWSARALPRGGIKLGHSVLRGTCWPDAHADEGEHSIAYALAPLSNASNSTVERLWRRFAHEPRVQLFSSNTPSAIVAACKPAEDGDGAIVRVRECDGAPANVRLRCGARMTWAASVDARERATYGAVAIEGEELVFELKPYEIRAFRVRFSHA